MPERGTIPKSGSQCVLGTNASLPRKRVTRGRNATQALVSETLAVSPVKLRRSHGSNILQALYDDLSDSMTLRLFPRGLYSRCVAGPICSQLHRKPPSCPIRMCKPHTIFTISFSWRQVLLATDTCNCYANLAGCCLVPKRNSVIQLI